MRSLHLLPLHLIKKQGVPGRVPEVTSADNDKWLGGRGISEEGRETY
jgi:hypothetical protein